jgi:hypothetical protein
MFRAESDNAKVVIQFGKDLSLLFEMTHGLCSCHSEQSEQSFSILRIMVD